MSCKKIKGCEGKIAMKRRDFLLGSIASVAAPAAFAAEDSAEQKPTPPPPQPTPPPPKPAEKLSTVERFACPEDGLFAVRPHLQLLGERSAAVVWMTKRKATGFVEWSQDGGAKWKRDWTEEDGLRDAGSFVHKTVLTGFDPSKSVRFRACSRANPEVRAYSATFEGEVEKVESELNPIVPADGKVSFAMFNDVHNKLDSYPALLKYLDRPVNFTVFNGDIMNSVETEEGLKKNLLAPLAYTSEKTHAAMWYLRGNHETRGAMARQLRDYLALPEGHYFGAVTLGAARIVFIDTGEDKHDSHPEYSGLVDFDRMEGRRLQDSSDAHSAGGCQRAWPQGSDRRHEAHVRAHRVPQGRGAVHRALRPLPLVRERRRERDASISGRCRRRCRSLPQGQARTLPRRDDHALRLRLEGACRVADEHTRRKAVRATHSGWHGCRFVIVFAAIDFAHVLGV